MWRAELRTAAGREWRAFLAALQFLTRIPIPNGSTGETWREDLARAPRAFPLAGGLVGLATGLVYALGLFLWPPPLAAAIALVFEGLLTGAFHEDGLADYCDAMGGGRDRDETLLILKDSRLGTYGALGLLLGVLCRWSALSAIPAWLAVAATAWAGALGRFAIVAATARLEPVRRRESLTKDIGARASKSDLAVAAGYAAPFAIAAAALFLPALTASIAAAFLVVFALTKQMRNRLGGVTGDGLGAIAFVTQAITLTIILALQ